ncbi:transcription-repair coupling factor [Halanaerobacter jeridensis]|uniref:Transcription-repair-coupling factor n=1 Tax=Halanaerobacter jeridensis TaxID=706427 RepID=A0A938XSV2_9FIRM|nr:transcription-repair coupling factor [Halanaerobacter jeridensis]MBM7557204.1 transcription-repair coupling factor (superfamily II helicase) [Halanaerobacter jeridensis]
MGNSLTNILKIPQVSSEADVDSGQLIGLEDSSKSFAIANISDQTKENVLVVTSNSTKADELYEDLVRITAEDKISLFPRFEIFPHEALEIEEAVKVERLQTLESICNARGQIILAPIQALLELVIPCELYSQYRIELSLNDQLASEKFSTQLVQMGYERVTQVQNKGQFSIRGGIIDFFSPIADKAVRIELFGDEIDSIRKFSIVDQRSEERLEQVIIPPATEFILPQDNFLASIQEIRKDLQDTIQDLSSKAADKLKEQVNYDIERLTEGIIFPTMRQYLKYFYNANSLFDYFKGTVVFDNWPRVEQQAIEFSRDIYETINTLINSGDTLKGYQEHFLDFNKVIYQSKDLKLYLSPLQKKLDKIDLDFNQEVVVRKLEKFNGKIKKFIKHIKKYLAEDYRIVIGLDNISKAKRLQKRLREEDLPAVVVSEIKDQIKVGNIILTAMNLSNGFILPEDKFILYTENELFKKMKRKRKRTKNIEQGVEISSFTDLKEGDYVVHENHGIGQYLGVETLEVNGNHSDYLLILYAGDDKLYVPTDQVDLIQKYVALEDKTPRLHKLDSDRWQKAKARAKESVEEMAEELLDLYAKREMKEGYAFSEDSEWQQKFEAAFPHEETPDQFKAIEAVKEDMESKQPMDRLICGDVGYGKTEVAIRAMFKAIIDGKQVAFLVPTTILAQQHFNNLVERFADYPINVGMLSRFRTASQQKEISAGLEEGTVDLVIGTHRLLSKDIEFKDLGLVVVDEEQRFGVAQKERLKELKENVDVLTLTATPIPRTLHMSLVGIRDISLIETPPENRYPIRTYVGEEEDELIKEALQREIKRGGQAYYVHNRVKDIKKVAAKIKNLLPEAEVAVAHGQMREKELERLMMSFLDGQYDVLVCTTIIENGMDIANANTIIIDQADKMGLAQLYQLRGRVGRSSQIAYAYLLYKQDKVLSEVAEKRLKAIKEFTNLGSGFKIAMRDMEIRGAGNILGPEQHGHIEAIGFSLYCKLLEKAVNRLKNEGVEEEEDIAVELEVNAFIPEDYVPDSKQKIEVYKKMKKVSSLEEATELEEELEDRFGALVEPVSNLLEVAKIEVYAAQLAITKIKEKKQAIMIKFSEQHSLSGEQVLELGSEFKRVKFSADKPPTIKIITSNLTDNAKLRLIIRLLKFLKE